MSNNYFFVTIFSSINKLKLNLIEFIKDGSVYSLGSESCVLLLFTVSSVMLFLKFLQIH